MMTLCGDDIFLTFLSIYSGLQAGMILYTNVLHKIYHV